MGPNSAPTGLSSLRDSVLAASNGSSNRSRYPGPNYGGPASSRGAYGLYGASSRGYSSYYPNYGSHNSYPKRERDPPAGQVYGPRKPLASAPTLDRYDSYLTDHDKNWSSYNPSRPRTRIRGSYLNTGTRDRVDRMDRNRMNRDGRAERDNRPDRGDFYRSYSGLGYNYRHIDRYSSQDRQENGSKTPSDTDSRPRTPSSSVPADTGYTIKTEPTSNEPESHPREHSPDHSVNEDDHYGPPDTADNGIADKDIEMDEPDEHVDKDLSEPNEQSEPEVLRSHDSMRDSLMSPTPELESYEPEEPKKARLPEPAEPVSGHRSAADEPMEPTINIDIKTDESSTVAFDDISVDGVISCQFGPLSRLDTEFAALTQEYQTLQHVKKGLVDFRKLPFFNTNFQLFHLHREHLVLLLRAKLQETESKKRLLWKLYDADYRLYEVKRKHMDEQLQLLHPEDDENRRELESIDIRAKNELQDSALTGHSGLSRRGGRRHGDSVTTEAEFQEILKSLERQQNQDPEARARRGAAVVPDMILDVTKRDSVKFMDANNAVKSKAAWTSRVKTDFVNNFNSQEHILFCEAFCLYPKRFGAISRHLGGLRTPEECVVHYYLTKKAVNYKMLAAQFKKKSIRKASKRGRPKSRNTSQSSTPVGTPTVEKDAEEYTHTITLPDESFGEEVYTETGRRKRAAAPTFEGKKKETTVIQIKKRKKKKEDEPQDPAVSQEEPFTIKKVTEEVEEHAPDSEDKKKSISSYWSITEATDFPRLLAIHGTNWIAIADSLSTKTATMVRNYFIRNAERNNWNEIVASIDPKAQVLITGTLQPSPELTSVSSSVSQTAESPEKRTISLGSLTQPLHERPTISSLLSNESPVKQENPSNVVPSNLAHPEHAEQTLQRPSIMNLLNSASSHADPPHRNDLRDLLNSSTLPK